MTEIIKCADDAERDLKFRKGDPSRGESDRWTARPMLAPCWHGDFREWRIEEGLSYQNQLYCGYWKEFINPNGHTCALCQKQLWPDIEHWRAHVIPAVQAENGDKAAQETLVNAVASENLTEANALALAEEFWPDTNPTTETMEAIQ